MHRFFCRNLTCDDAELEAGEEVHLFRTLRARPGDRIGLLDGNGTCAEAEVKADRSLQIFRFEKVPEPRRKLMLYCAAPRKNKMELMLRPAVELGVREIRLLDCEHSVALPEKPERFDLLLREGCKQSGNPFLPIIRPPRPLNEALEDLKNEGGTGFFGAVAAEKSDNSLPHSDTGPLAWFVGPEGGFSEEEEAAMRASGIQPLHLAPHILRLETAAIAGLAVLQFFQINPHGRPSQ